MSEAGLFSAAVDKANQWLDVVSTALGDDDHPRAWSVLRGVLQVVRDHLTREEAVRIGAQLPLIIRGAFYEGWHPAEAPVPIRSASGFLAEIGMRIDGGRSQDFDPERAFLAVVTALRQCGMGQELARVQRQLPEAVQELWQATA